jgi:hypothetical protein
MFISILYMFRATSYSSSGESIVSIHLHIVTITARCIDTIDSPDDEHEVDRNTQRTEINI